MHYFKNKSLDSSVLKMCSILFYRLVLLTFCFFLDVPLYTNVSFSAVFDPNLSEEEGFDKFAKTDVKWKIASDSKPGPVEGNSSFYYVCKYSWVVET